MESEDIPGTEAVLTKAQRPGEARLLSLETPRQFPMLFTRSVGPRGHGRMPRRDAHLDLPFINGMDDRL